jgi:hypothetical protein
MKKNDAVIGVFIMLLLAAELTSYAALLDGQKIAIQLIEISKNAKDIHVLVDQYFFIHREIQGYAAFDVTLAVMCIQCIKSDRSLLA